MASWFQCFSLRLTVATQLPHVPFVQKKLESASDLNMPATKVFSHKYRHTYCFGGTPIREVFLVIESSYHRFVAVSLYGTDFIDKKSENQ